MSNVGVCEWCLPVWGPFSLEFAGKCGFEGVQLTDLRGVHWGYPMNNEIIQEGYKEASAKTGVMLHSMHLMALSHSTGLGVPMDTPKGQLAKLSIEKGVAACAAMGIPVINISGGIAYHAEPDGSYSMAPDAMKNLYTYLRYSIDLASDKGIRIVYETCDDIEIIYKLLDAVPGLLLNYDISNSITLGTGFQMPMSVTDKIDHVHVKDHVFDPVTHARLDVIAGTGQFETAKGIHLLKEHGYDGWYLSEAGYVMYTLPEDVASGTFADYYATEIDINSHRSPLPFGLGDDLTVVCRKDCEAIKQLVKNA